MRRVQSGQPKVLGLACEAGYSPIGEGLDIPVVDNSLLTSREPTQYDQQTVISESLVLPFSHVASPRTPEQPRYSTINDDAVRRAQICYPSNNLASPAARGARCNHRRSGRLTAIPLL
jgi:hypothetical protein